MNPRRNAPGYTLLELLIGAALLLVIATTTYYLLNALDRGLVLLNGQLAAQDNPREGMIRLIADLQESNYINASNVPTPTYSPTVQVGVVGVVCAAVAAQATSLTVDNATGLAPGVTVTIYAMSRMLASTSENITLTAAAITSAANCASYDKTIGNMQGGAYAGTTYGAPAAYTLNFATALKNSYPWGAIVVPAAVANYATYTISASNVAGSAPAFGLLRTVAGTGGTVNTAITGFSAPGFSSTLAQAAPAGGTGSLDVNMQNNTCPFTTGNAVYLLPASAGQPLQIIGIQYPPQTAAGTCVLYLSDGSQLGQSYAAGSFVQTMPNVASLNVVANAGATQITVNNAISGYCFVKAGDVIVIDPGPNQEVRSVGAGSALSNCTGSAGATTQITLGLVQDYTQPANGQPLAFTHAAGALVMRRAAQVGLTSGYQLPAAGGGTVQATGVPQPNSPGLPSDYYLSEGFGRN